MVRRTRAEMEETRATLLSTARQVFSEHGYAGTSMDELTARAGLTRGALYHHFGDKQGLLAAVVASINAELDARLAELGGSRLFAVGLADLDIDTVATPWREQALAHARDLLKTPAAVPATSATVTPLRPGHAAAWSHEHPFPAELLLNPRISMTAFIYLVAFEAIMLGVFLLMLGYKVRAATE